MGETVRNRLAGSVPGAVVAGWRVGQWPWLVPVAAFAATAAWVLGALSGQAAGAVRIAFIAIGAVLTSVAVGLPLWQQRRANQARADAVAAAQAARAAMRITLEDALDPFVHVVGALTTAKGADKARLRGAAVQLTVATIAGLAGAERVRVCFFELESGRPRRLRPERFAGRAGAPTVTLTEGEPAGDAALRMISRRAWTFIDDTRREPLPFSWDGSPEYRTVLLGPVATPEEVVGMLTVDALHPGELATVDPTLVRLLADLLAAALRM
ncbi:MAG TPA: hypothetical protein VGX25_28610 [Actinophytocola sp.]|uniref:hypothetical protein n=1 Tax=Actinophytocola sp. TaxID=1872138 RepID=UPI002DDD8144|nr:hypothetical protein [Actinophytocola sp.]HEV2783364.1 hypothetical protein [Actinophytocola sp.]